MEDDHAYLNWGAWRYNMEEWIRKNAQEILLKYPIIKFIEWHYNFVQNDLININAVAQLYNHNNLKVLVKCGSRNNFMKFGKCRNSFILGDYYSDIKFSRDDMGASFPDLLLTCYRTVDKNQDDIYGEINTVAPDVVLKPYALIKWPCFIRRYYESGKDVVNKDHNSKDGSAFGWINYKNLLEMNILASHAGNPIIDISEWQT